jgi:hypothetical protein
MSAMVKLSHSSFWQLISKISYVRYRHDFVIATVVKIDFSDRGKLRRKIPLQNILLYIPVLLSPITPRRMRNNPAIWCCSFSSDKYFNNTDAPMSDL